MDGEYVLNIDSVFFLPNDETVLLLKEVCLSSRSPTHTVTAAVFRSLFISVHMDSGEKRERRTLNSLLSLQVLQLCFVNTLNWLLSLSAIKIKSKWLHFAPY